MYIIEEINMLKDHGNFQKFINTISCTVNTLKRSYKSTSYK